MISLSAYSSAADMLAMLDRRAVSATELLTLHRRRQERFRELNVIVTENPAAFDTAAAADVARAHGRQAPLLGLPITIKDCIYMAGLPTTGGLPARASLLDTDDAPVTARLREAGAVIMGKTNVPPYASDWQADNPLFGRTLNPWHHDRTPGGSTGGAAAVAAGLTPLEFGGDFYGSIRIPAAFCGIFGHKPTLSAIPGTGHFPAGLTPNPAAAMAVIGPLARTPHDLDLALRVIAGPERDEASWRLTFPEPRHSRLADFRVAVMPWLTWLPVERSIVDALERLQHRLQAAGVTTSTTMPPELGDLRGFHHDYLAVVSAISSIRTPRHERQEQADIWRAQGDEFLNAWADGLTASAQDYLEWSEARSRFRAAFTRFFSEWDVLLAPANLVNAFPHGVYALPGGALSVNNVEVDYGQQTVYAGLANFTGLPATAFPAGLSPEGLPIGLQAIGPYLEDRTTLRFTELLEEVGVRFTPPPAYPPEF